MKFLNNNLLLILAVLSAVGIIVFFFNMDKNEFTEEDAKKLPRCTVSDLTSYCTWQATGDSVPGGPVFPPNARANSARVKNYVSLCVNQGKSLSNVLWSDLISNNSFYLMMNPGNYRPGVKGCWPGKN
jgi:hypothetical protein